VRAAGDPPVTIQSFAFHPQTITIGAGDTVTWTNRDDAAHTATGTGGSFDTGTLQRGQSGSHTFTSAGRFSYICAIHPSMTGTVVVTGAGSSGGGGSGGSSHSAGSGGGSSSGSGTASGSASGNASTSSGALPHTGLELLVVVLVGMLLTGSGVALRLLLDGAQALAGRRAGSRG
jgi:hypothetical protein